MAVHLLARHRVLATRRLTFERNAIVGRGQHCELILQTANVSSFHARFELRPDGVLLVSDLDSTNGTYLSGRRLGALPEEMGPEDRVLIGDWTFILAPGDPARPFDGRAARESELFAGLVTKPNDDDLRQVYSDWLEENGHAREVEVLSLERQMRRSDGRLDTVEHGRLAFRLRMLAEQLPPAWCVAVMRPHIEGCPYSDKCPRDWDALAKLPDPFVRRCRSCDEEVGFDEGRARRSGNAEITTLSDQTKVTGLPFFAADTPPTTIGALFRGLRVAPPQGLNDATGMFTVNLPTGARIEQVSVRFAWDVGNDMPLRRFEEVEFAPVNDVAVVFHGDSEEIEDWLRARFGPPQDATQSLWPGAPMPMQTRAYGNWIFRNEGTGCRLNWFRIRPGWDLPVDHEDIACAFVRELDERLRTGCTAEEMTELASLPPRHSGIVVRGYQSDAFWLTFEPRLRAVALTEALGLVDPVGTRSGGQGRSWRVVEAARTTPSRLRQDGNWILEIMLEGSASGRVRENDRQLSGADHALGIRLRRPIQT